MAFRRKHPFFNRDADLPAVEDERDFRPPQGLLFCGVKHRSTGVVCTIEAGKPHVIHIARDPYGKVVAQWENYG